MFKKAFTLCMASLMAVSLFAADIASRITLSSAAYNQYVLLIDGRNYPLNSSRTHLANLRPGRHTIEVYDRQRTTRRNNRPVHAATFTVRPQYNMHIDIDRNGYVHFDETRVRNSRNADDRFGRNDRNWNDRDNRDWNDRDDRYGRDDNRYDNNQWERNRALSDNDYSGLVQRIRNQWTGSRKFSLAQEAVTTNYFTTEQVSGLLQLFSSESQRIDLAKRAYQNVVDGHNYSRLYSLFSRSAQTDLDRFIRSNRF